MQQLTITVKDAISIQVTVRSEINIISFRCRAMMLNTKDIQMVDKSS